MATPSDHQAARQTVMSENKASSLRREIYYAFTHVLIRERERCYHAIEISRRQRLELWKRYVQNPVYYL